MKKFLGTSYGGWLVNLDLINDGDYIIDAGLGEDISFIEELLIHKKINIIGVDPTTKSHLFLDKKELNSFKLFKKAIAPFGTNEITMYKNTNPNYVSESYYLDHGSVSNNGYNVECISFKELITTYKPSLIKMDIEGAEYDVLLECIGIPQVCVEFHHHCMTSKTFDDTQKLINLMIENNYQIIDNRNNIEFTFIIKN